jgi:hypothetical protein
MTTLFLRSTSASITAVAAARLSNFDIDKTSTMLFDACLYILGRNLVGVVGMGNLVAKLV